MMDKIADLIDCLTKNHQTVAVAESCTGGMIASSIVDVAGASACFGEGYVTYSNQAKEKNLGVLHESLTLYGAVSPETAREMAEGVRNRAEADFGLATTGIAGPDGGTPEKPVGLVYIACAGKNGTEVMKRIFPGDRSQVRQAATAEAISLLYRTVKETCQG